jgi:hypothetical protein
MKYRLSIMVILFTFFGGFGSQAMSNTPAEDIAVKVLNEGVNVLEPQNVFVWLEIPKNTKLNSTVYLKVEIKNLREKEKFAISSIDLDSSLGKGFRVKKITPKPINMDSALEELSAEYNFSVAPGETKHVIFELVAVNVGVYKGDVDVWEGDNMVTRVAQISIEK